MKKVFALILIIITLGTYAFAIEYPYTDLKIQVFDRYGRPAKDKQGNLVYEPHPALREINILTKIGLIDGYEDGTFRPENTITRAEYIKMIMILATNRTFNFETIPTSIKHWAAPYLVVAEMQGVIDKGIYNSKNLDEPITRIEMICMLSRIQIRMKGIVQNREGKLQYTDIGGLTAEQKDLLLHAAKYVLLDGMLDYTEFEPNKNLTRAEATISIMRIY